MSRTITRTRTTTRTVQQTTELDPNDRERQSLVLVSWDLSAKNISAVAPNPQLRKAEAPRLIREEILRSSRPDIIALQKTLNKSYGSSHYADYVSMGSQPAWAMKKNASLDGTYIDLLVKRELTSNAERITFQTFEMQELPVIAAIVTLPNRTRIAVASLHLPHAKTAAPLRKRLCNAIMEQMTSQQCEGIILAGDFNMRKSEDNEIEGLCGGNWVDAWKAVTRSNYRKEFTWDSHENLYHGHDSFQYHCRFDRCYVRGDKLRLNHFDLIGNKPVNKKKGDYLSDHYGIVVKIDVGSTTGSASLPSVNHAQNADAIRAARLQRFERASANTNSNQRNEIKSKRMKKQHIDATDSLIDLSKESDDEDDCTKKSSSSRGQYKHNNDNNMVDLTEDSDDEIEILQVAAASSTILAPQINENDSHSDSDNSHSTTKDDDEEELKPTAANNSSRAGHIEDIADINAEEEEEEVSPTKGSDIHIHARCNQTGEHSVFTQAEYSEPASPSPSLHYASSTASTPIRDNRAPKRTKKETQTKRKKLCHLGNSSSDEDDFDIMRAKLAKRKLLSTNDFK